MKQPNPWPPVAVTAVAARISETTPRDLRGVEVLRKVLEEGLGVDAHMLEGRRQPFGRTPWEDDLTASRELLRVAGQRAAVAMRSGSVPITLATDCALAMGTLPAARAAQRDGARVLWLDAHADYDTPETTTAGFLGCMSLAGACGAWDSGLGAIEPGSVVHLGARAQPGDFDYPGQCEAERSGMTMIPPARGHCEAVMAALGDAPVYVHLDPDVLDPLDNPVPYGRAGGLRAAELHALLRTLARRGPVVGMEITAFHSDDAPALRRRMARLLVDAVCAALASGAAVR